MRHHQQHTITIAILGGNTVAGSALALLLNGVGYDTRVLEVPGGRIGDLLEGVEVMLICLGLSTKRRRQGLAPLKSIKGRMGLPVRELSSAIEKGLHPEGVGIVL